MRHLTGCVEELSTSHIDANQKKPMIESNRQKPMNWCTTKQKVASLEKCEAWISYSF